MHLVLMFYMKFMSEISIKGFLKIKPSLYGLLVVGVLLLLLGSCISVKNYNERVVVLHQPDDLKEDVDFIYNKLQKLHPRLYQFVSKEVLDNKFDSLKATITEPMLSKDFYYKLSPIIAEVRQGHISMGFPQKRFTRKERKVLKKSKLGFNDLDFEYLENKLWVTNAKGIDSVLIGSEVLAVNNKKVTSLLDQYKKTFSSDGYNTTFKDRIVGMRFAGIYRKYEGFLDSISLTLRLSDSVFIKNYKRVFKDSLEAKPIIKDSLKTKKRIKPTKTERKLAKVARRQKKKDHKKYGYISEKDTYTRNFKFIDSSNQIAYFKIRNWNNGNYKKFYEESFSTIDSVNAKFLVLDLRDNTGGRLAEIQDFYSYLVAKEFQFVNKAEVNTRLPYVKGFYGKNSNVFSIIQESVALPFLITLNLLNSRKEKNIIRYNYKQARNKKPNPLNFKGKIYVLINGNSFSASSILSTNLKATNRAVFVGEETGGAYNGTVAGHYKVVYLPHSNIGVKFGLMHIQSPYEEDVIGLGIRPNIEIYPTAKNRKDGMDPELEWVLENIRKKK